MERPLDELVEQMANDLRYIYDIVKASHIDTLEDRMEAFYFVMNDEQMQTLRLIEDLQFEESVAV